MQTIEKSFNIEQSLNWIGKELKIYDRNDEDDHHYKSSQNDHYMNILQNEWLLNYSDTHLAVSRDCKLVAFAHYRHCYICMRDDDSSSSNEFELIQVNSPCKYEGEKITCLMWISFNTTTAAAGTQNFLLIGSSEGYLRVYSAELDKIVREERFHDLEIVKIRSQSVFHSTLLPNFQKEIILIIYPNHVVTMDPLNLKKELNSNLNTTTSNTTTTSSNSSGNRNRRPINFSKVLLEYKKWNLQQFAKLNDACCLYSHCSDISSPSSHSLFQVMEEEEKKKKCEFDIVAVGKSTLALYSTAAAINDDDDNDSSQHQHQQQQYIRKRTRVKKIATQVATTVYNLASNYSSWLWGGNSSNNNSSTVVDSNNTEEEEEEETPTTTEMEEPEILPGSRIPITNRFIDEKREIFHADLDLTGKYLATSDSLGRILIFDLSTMTVMRVFKGYREAHCYWFFTTTTDTTDSSTNNSKEGENDQLLSTNSSAVQLLLIFAPRRGILECWTIDGRRICALTVGDDKRFVKASGSFVNEGRETVQQQHQQNHQHHNSQFYLISQTDGSIQQIEFNISIEQIQSSTFGSHSGSSGGVNPFKLLLDNKI